MLTAFYEFLIWATLIHLFRSGVVSLQAPKRGLARAILAAASQYAERRALDRQATIEYERHRRRQNYFY